MKRGRIEISAARPSDCGNLRINTGLGKNFRIPKRAVKLAFENRLKIDCALKAIIEAEAQRKLTDALKCCDAINWMCHGDTLLQRCDG